MKHSSRLTLAIAATLSLGLAHVQAMAQATAQTAAPAKSTAQKPATPAPANKAAPAKAQAKTKAPAKAAAAAPVLAAADPAQLEAAERTYFGNYACELDQHLDIGMNAKAPGYVDVTFKSKTFTMKPIVSSTGALRLEEVKGGMLLIQISNKSMMMDTKAGQRVVDGCVHEKQRAAAAMAGKT